MGGGSVSGSSIFKADTRFGIVHIALDALSCAIVFEV